MQYDKKTHLVILDGNDTIRALLPLLSLGKAHRKIEPKDKHFSHGKKDQSSRPNQTDNSKRLAKITQSYIKEFREDSNIIHR